MQPKARRANIIVKDFEGDCLLFDENSLRVHELNAAATSVWRHADGDTTVAGLTTAMAAETGLPADEEIVRLALVQLSKAGLLEGPQSAFDARISRRQICERLGLTGSVSLLLPIVSSIVAPTPAMAQSHSPTIAPTIAPTSAPDAPAQSPSQPSTSSPTGAPTSAPTGGPTLSPTGSQRHPRPGARRHRRRVVRRRPRPPPQ